MLFADQLKGPGHLGLGLYFVGRIRVVADRPVFEAACRFQCFISVHQTGSATFFTIWGAHKILDRFQDHLGDIFAAGSLNGFNIFVDGRRQLVV